ncbi:hypothetical protein HK102_012677, partial [Quaeritorhiza haematococci]
SKNLRGFSKPIELTTEGYFQIGSGSDSWSLSITLAFAENLSLLCSDLTTGSRGPGGIRGGGAGAGPSSSSTTTKNEEYYFLYSLLDHDIVTSKFQTLKSPQFATERVSMHFKASYEDLVTFLKELSSFVVYLCAEEQPPTTQLEASGPSMSSSHRMLGFADVPLSPLVQDMEGWASSPQDPNHHHKVIEKVYNMYDMREELPMAQDGNTAGIGLSITLASNSGGIVTVMDAFARGVDTGKGKEKMDVAGGSAPLTSQQPGSPTRPAIT